MENKKIIIASLLLVLSSVSYGQSNARWVRTLPTPQISIGFGSSKPSSTAKDNAFLVNSPALNADVYLPFLALASRKGSNAEWSKMSIGGNLGGTYNFSGSGEPTKALPNGFALTGQTANIIAYKGGHLRQSGFRMGGGPQINFNLSPHFIISAVLSGEYFRMTQSALSTVQTTQYNGQSYEFILNQMPETKTSGFAITPKLRMQYVLGNGLGFFVESAYTTGPTIETQSTILVPDGIPKNGTYDISQVQNGQQKREIAKSSYRTVSFTGGLRYNVGCTFCGHNHKNRYCRIGKASDK